MFLWRRSVSLLQLERIGFGDNKDCVVINDPVDVVIIIYSDFDKRYFSPFIQYFKKGTNRRVLFWLFLCILVRIGNINKIYQVGRSIAICKRIRRWHYIVSCTAMVRINRFIRYFRATIFFQVVRPAQASEGIALNYRPLVAIDVTMLRFTVIKVAKVGFSNARREPINNSNGSFLISSPATAKSPVKRGGYLQLRFIGRFVNSQVIMVYFTISDA